MMMIYIVYPYIYLYYQYIFKNRGLTDLFASFALLTFDRQEGCSEGATGCLSEWQAPDSNRSLVLHCQPDKQLIVWRVRENGKLSASVWMLVLHCCQPDKQLVACRMFKKKTITVKKRKKTRSRPRKKTSFFLTFLFSFINSHLSVCTQ